MQSSLVCIVDDNEKVLQLTSLEVEDCGFDCVVFNNPFSFLSDVGSLSPSVILLDIMMPQMNGFDCLASLVNANISCPVLMFTSINDDMHRDRASSLGASGYFLKPDLLSSPCSIINSFIR